MVLMIGMRAAAPLGRPFAWQVEPPAGPDDGQNQPVFPHLRTVTLGPVQNRPRQRTAAVCAGAASGSCPGSIRVSQLASSADAALSGSR